MGDVYFSLLPSPLTLDNYESVLAARQGSVNFGAFNCAPDARDPLATICIGNPRLREVGANYIVKGNSRSRLVNYVGVVAGNPEMMPKDSGAMLTTLFFCF